MCPFSFSIKFQQLASISENLKAMAACVNLKNVVQQQGIMVVEADEFKSCYRVQ
jgi:hypothetical protein